MDHPTIRDVLVVVTKAIPLDASNYPRLKGESIQGGLAFAISHALKHQLKSMGKVASILEDFDHGNEEALASNAELLETSFVKIFGSVARVLAELDLNGDEIFDILKREFKGPPESLLPLDSAPA